MRKTIKVSSRFWQELRQVWPILEEFLKNRDTRGIHDQVYLGLLPKLNIYRPDLVPSDLSLSQYPALNVAAVLLSHAHMDHAGNLGLLKREIPIVASPESIVILKGMQDSSNSSLDTDTTYISLRKPSVDESFYLEPAGGKDCRQKSVDFFIALTRIMKNISISRKTLENLYLLHGKILRSSNTIQLGSGDF